MTSHDNGSTSDNSIGGDFDPAANGLTPEWERQAHVAARRSEHETYSVFADSDGPELRAGLRVAPKKTDGIMVELSDGSIVIDAGYTRLPPRVPFATERTGPAPDWYDTVHAGSGVDVLEGLPDNSIDAIVTGPPWKGRSPMPATRRRIGEMWPEIERVLSVGAKVCIIGPSGYRPSAAHAHAGNGTGPLGLGYLLGTRPGEDIAKGYQIINYEAPVGADVRSIAEELIVQHTSALDVVLDPAAFDGEVLVAAAHLGRHYLGLEKTAKRAANARRRLRVRSGVATR